MKRTSFFYKQIVKSMIDISVAGFVLLLLMPLFLLVALLIRIESKGPVFYFQNRLGKKGKIFRLVKFRSMTHRTKRVPGETGELLGNTHAEITRIGKVLRRLKIDELPQLFNIIQGHMSLVGPRPSLPELQEQFDKNGQARLLVKPGCTGLAQIHGNIYLSWPERWQYDAYYTEKISLLLDLKIIIKTFFLIFAGEKKFHVPFAVFQKKNS